MPAVWLLLLPVLSVMFVLLLLSVLLVLPFVLLLVLAQCWMDCSSNMLGWGGCRPPPPPAGWLGGRLLGSPASLRPPAHWFYPAAPLACCCCCSDDIVRWVKKKTGPATVEVASDEELEKAKSANKVFVLGYFEKFEGDGHEAYEKGELI